MVDKSVENVILDPLKDRVVKSVPKPPRFPLGKNDLFKTNGKKTLIILLMTYVGKNILPDSPLLRKHLLIEGTVTKECLMHLLKEVTAVFRK